MSELGFKFENVTHRFDNRGAEVIALQNVSFVAQPGEFICLVGPSGCGKSTILRILAGLLDPTSGNVLFGDGLTGARPTTALVFQEHGVFPWMTVRDNVAFGLEMQGISKSERNARANALLDEFGLSGFASSYPQELSVGMRQRVGVARAFISEVQLLLMDEPFGSLDALTRRTMQEELLRLWRKHGHTLVFVTHDVDEAAALADRIIVFSRRPATVLKEFVLPADRPRGPSSRRIPEVRQTSRLIWDLVMSDSDPLEARTE